MPYVPGTSRRAPGPLSRFLPPLEAGTAATWLSSHVPSGSWLLDPFGFSLRLPVEAARAGYRVLVTVNNPVTRFLLELEADPPPEVDFTAALAELAASKRGEERLETHIQSLYVTRCEQCKRKLQAAEFLWRKGSPAPYARIYHCSECGDSGERPVDGEDVERARQIAASDGLHRSRALERVAARNDPERVHVQEALQHYLPRPLYVLTTIINRVESLGLTPRRQRALVASILIACDAGNSLWGLHEQRPRPKQLITSDEFREQNLWSILESAGSFWQQAGAPVACVQWPNQPPEPAGICIYEGRLKQLAEEVRKEIPIAAGIGSVPRPNQAFWTLSALWAGWLWGHAAVEPYRMALRRRRYDWTWNATALQAAFGHLAGLLALGTPFFGLLPEAEPQFLLAAMSAVGAGGFDLEGLALRTEDDPVQFLWERGERLPREVEQPDVDALRSAMVEHLEQRCEPVSYLHVEAVALERLAQGHALQRSGQDMEAALHGTRGAIEAALERSTAFAHLTSGESLEAGLWGLAKWPDAESLSDRLEVLLVNYLQKHPESSTLELEQEAFRHLPGLFTPSRRAVLEVLNSYATPSGTLWRLREEDRAARRKDDLRHIADIVRRTGQALSYKARDQGEWIMWEENSTIARAFYVLASAIMAPALRDAAYPAESSILVVPGGRIELIKYKLSLRSDLAERMRGVRISRFSLWRSLADVKMMTRESLSERLASDAAESTPGQMMMF